MRADVGHQTSFAECRSARKDDYVKESRLKMTRSRRQYKIIVPRGISGSLIGTNVDVHR